MVGLLRFFTGAYRWSAAFLSSFRNSLYSICICRFIHHLFSSTCYLSICKVVHYLAYQTLSVPYETISMVFLLENRRRGLNAEQIWLCSFLCILLGCHYIIAICISSHYHNFVLLKCICYWKITAIKTYGSSLRATRTRTQSMIT